MYRKIEGIQRMKNIEAMEKYPDSYIIMRMESKDISNQMGIVLYVGDDEDELFPLMQELTNAEDCCFMEGSNLQCSLGGLW